MASKRLHFTAHHNWDWVVTQAFNGGGYDNCTKHKRFSELPSAIEQQEKKGRYALFRLDIIVQSDSAGEQRIRTIRLDSSCMEDLDPKDSLYRKMVEANVTEHAPHTHL
ncbi:hypothetical protein EON64_14785, partial [archaeon]